MLAQIDFKGSNLPSFEKFWSKVNMKILHLSQITNTV